MQEQGIERRLAVILAADVAGYSRMMSADEEGTLHVLRGHREAFDALIRQHRGRIFNTAGDSVVAEFSSPVDAVRCAVETQRALVARNASLPATQRMSFRIGINLGDVVVQGSDLMGEGVNIAARLEAIADPGGILITRSVYEPVRAAVPLDYRSLGKQRLKNITRPVAVYSIGATAAGRPLSVRSQLVAAAVVLVLLLAGGGAWLMLRQISPAPEGAALPAATANRPSIAVLPFINLSGDPEQDYFGDSMTEDLITDLSKLAGLFVIARNSTFVYKGRAASIPDIGRELGVRYVVEGSVRRAGERIRINAQLVDATSGLHLWGERYDREFKDIFDLQDDVRRNIVAALAVKLSPGESVELNRRPTNSVEAYDFWARGLDLLSRFTADDNREARRMFLRAVQIDPSFARAYGQISNTYSLEIERGWSTALNEAAANAILYGQRAVALDANLPEARLPLGRAYDWQQQHARAFVEFERAITLNPNYADGLAYYALVLGQAGRAAEGMAYLDRAIKINPHHPFWYLVIVGDLNFILGRYDVALASLRQAIERNPNSTRARRMLIATYGQLGRREDAQWEIGELNALGQRLTLTDAQRLTPLQKPEDRARFLDGLRKAGVAD